jgi:hypothetical protein
MKWFFAHKKKFADHQLTVSLLTLFVVCLIAVALAADYVTRALVYAGGRTTVVQTTAAVPPSAPSSDAYERDAAAVVGPVLSDLMTSSWSEVVGDAGRKAAVETAQTALLDMKVPSSRRDVHLAVMLALDAWRRATEGTMVDQTAAQGKTLRLLEAYPWFWPGQPEGAAAKAVER